MHGGWPHRQSPFHEGEQWVQERLGVRSQIEAFARRVVRDHLPAEHRDFYEMISYIVLGTVDDQGWPWGSILAAEPGFISSPDPHHLSFNARFLTGDPLMGNLKPDNHIGLLGIDLASRRRNRVSGRLVSVRDGNFTVVVDQAYGNCPQYIQARDIVRFDNKSASGNASNPNTSRSLDRTMCGLIENSDTFFIATAYLDGADRHARGVDVSHRGGKPGFVRVEDDRTFVFPDFSGNNHYNTIGNIVQNPRAGFLFVDFGSGTAVYLTGEAEIVWDAPEISAFEGAERLVRVRAHKVIYVENSLPLRWRLDSYSPSLARTGSWNDAYVRLKRDREQNSYQTYEVFKVEIESDAISSFYLRRKYGQKLPPHKPGQFLPIKTSLPGHDKPETRTYTISNAPNDDYFRLSVKRESAGARVSNYLHDHATPGFQLEAMPPRGKFVLEKTSRRPAVLLSAGVGITPMVAMMESIIKEAQTTKKTRKVYFVHGARNSTTQAFAARVRNLAECHSGAHVHIRFSQPLTTDVIGTTYDSEGHVDVELLQHLLPIDDYEFYLCGPATFMLALYDGLAGLGVRQERIHYESFGPATVLHSSSKTDQSGVADGAVGDPIDVRFAISEVNAKWRPTDGTLLELAEAAGLSPNFACRSGLCGTCATRMTCGKVNYIEEPTAAYGDDEILLCCAVPRYDCDPKTCGQDCGIVLEL